VNYPGAITRAVCGSPDFQTLPEYACPVCGAQLLGGDRLAENKDGDTVGCDYCIRYYEIWEKDLNDNRHRKRN
jgi:DNA-directed RNA polymerase subunit RPC12/RpoP